MIVCLDFGPLGPIEAFFRETVRLALGDCAAADIDTRDIRSMTTLDLQYTFSYENSDCRPAAPQPL